MSESAVAIFSVRSANTLEVFENALGALVELDDLKALSCRVKAGYVGNLIRRVSRVEYTAANDKVRRRDRWQEEVPYAAEEAERKALVSALTFHVGAPQLLWSPRSAYECLVLNGVTIVELLRALDYSKPKEPPVAVVSFSGNSQMPMRYLWRYLPLRYLITGGYILERSQWSIVDLDFDYGEEVVENQDWANVSRPWKHKGMFLELDDDRYIYLERQVSELDIPEDLRVARPIEPSEEISSRPGPPTEIVLGRIPWKTSKVSKLDDPGSKAFHKTSQEPLDQWPDPEQVKKKIILYCLNREHKERKWIGFAKVGYMSERVEDVEYLTYALCSAILDLSLAPYDIRASADGTLEFAIDVLLPSRFGPKRVTTAWNAQNGKRVALSSAYVSSGRKPLSEAILIPEHAAEGDWESFYNWMSGRASVYGKAVASSPYQATGLLWIPHAASDTARAFALWSRRSGHASPQRFRRKAAGGYCTLLSIGFPITGVTEVVGALIMAQVCLGLRGIKSIIEYRYD
ncbi:hypothetical protein AB0F52_32670 [Amycolatopsis sp. NPDC024027]|uniref:hypothetical protein n=1 Tax=Amycolatopsis sp. NPDC024027 TaxID=3154327 RepID=UPI0033E3B70E